jgi:SAM-dependent methyltransferase
MLEHRTQEAMVVDEIANEEQTRLWNGPAGTAWVESQEILDRMFRPFEELLVAELVSTGALRVLDVGCGTGATTLAAARRLGASARCVGVDLSQAMIELARRRAAREQLPAEFIVADAQTQDFGSAVFDALISRFGVMFFADPLRAFANLRRAVRPSGRLSCLVFRGAGENPFMTTAERAAAPLLPGLPPRRAGGPGQFAFADAGWVRGMLAKSGWNEAACTPVDVECGMPAAALAGYVTRLGPVGMVIRQADEATRARVIPAVLEAFQPYVRGAEIRFNAACWLVSAIA